MKRFDPKTGVLNLSQCSVRNNVKVENTFSAAKGCDTRMSECHHTLQLEELSYLQYIRKTPFSCK